MRQPDHPVLTPLLWLLSLIYRLLVWMRNKGYDWGVFKTRHVAATVISES